MQNTQSGIRAESGFGLIQSLRTGFNSAIDWCRRALVVKDYDRARYVFRLSGGPFDGEARDSDEKFDELIIPIEREGKKAIAIYRNSTRQSLLSDYAELTFDSIEYLQSTSKAS